MIYDSLDNMLFYCSRGDKLHRALKYAIEFDLSQPDGDYEVEGKDMIAKVQSYNTSPAEERKFESHKEYYDVQVIRQGAERHDVSLETDLEPLAAFDTIKDVVKLKAPSAYSSLGMDEGKFAVYYPQDVHRPNCNLDGVSKVRKYV